MELDFEAGCINPFSPLRRLDSVLNAEGIKQAHVLAHRLKREVFTHVYSSDLTRCKQVGWRLVDAPDFPTTDTTLIIRQQK